MPDITMPRLSDTMEDGVILTWIKNIGDPIEPGDILVEIETDKAVMELEAYDKGILERVLVAEGDRVPVGVLIATIGDGSGISSEPEPPAPLAATPTPTPTDVSPAVRSQPSDAEPAGRPKASPLARKLAAEKGIDLAAVTGSGPSGRIIRKDVVDAAETLPVTAIRPSASNAPNAPNDSDAEEVALTTMQRVAAKRLTESKRTAPHFYLTAAIDVTDLLMFRERLNETLQAVDKPKISVNDFIIRGVAVTLRDNPGVNVSYGRDKLLRHRGVHIGVAVAVDGGLVVPVIRYAEHKTVSEIAFQSKELASRARIGKLRIDEMSGSTFTISNLGMYGIEQFAAVINPPEAAILAVGAATEELRLIDGEVVGRTMLRVTLSADHRAIDGSTGAIFLRELTKLLQDPFQVVV